MDKKLDELKLTPSDEILLSQELRDDARREKFKNLTPDQCSGWLDKSDAYQNQLVQQMIDQNNPTN